MIGSANHFAHVVRRAKDEFHVFANCAKSFTFCLFVLLYFCLGVFRNLAYHFNPQTGPLHDVMHSLFGQLPPHLLILPEIPFYLLTVIALSALLIPVLVYPQRRELSMVRMGLHLTYSITFLQVSRSIFYLATSLPDPSPKCQPGAPNYDPPSIREAFMMFELKPNNVCGDLIFSGHTLIELLFALFVYRYAHRVMPHRLAIALRVVSTILIVIGLPLILAARNHYTVDVLVSLYITPGVWSWIGNRYGAEKFPLDRELLPLDDDKGISNHSFTKSASKASNDASRDASKEASFSDPLFAK